MVRQTSLGLESNLHLIQQQWSGHSYLKNDYTRFIKPCRRLNEAHRSLTPEYALQQFKNGNIVQINVENSTLQRMERIYENPTLEQATEVGLLPLIELLGSAPIALTAVGLHEMPEWRVSNSILAYERFCETFWPSHKNDSKAKQRDFNPNAKALPVVFTELSAENRLLYGAKYVAFLHMQHVMTSFEKCSPEEKFDIYIYGIVSMLDLISTFEVEIAKYAFWELTSNQINQLPEDIRIRRGDIRNNFTKPQSSFRKCTQAAFNSAMDLQWLSGANLAEDLKLDIEIEGKIYLSDNWIATNDIKLYRICKDLHSVFHEGSTMKGFATAREVCMTAIPYWQTVDARSKEILRQRSTTHKFDDTRPPGLGRRQHTSSGDPAGHCQHRVQQRLCLGDILGRSAGLTLARQSHHHKRDPAKRTKLSGAECRAIEAEVRSRYAAGVPALAADTLIDNLQHLIH